MDADVAALPMTWLWCFHGETTRLHCGFDGSNFLSDEPVAPFSMASGLVQIL
jgi:hypothetical protein